MGKRRTTTVAKGRNWRERPESPPPLALRWNSHKTSHSPKTRTEKGTKALFCLQKNTTDLKACVLIAEVGITALFSPDCLSRGRGPWHDISHWEWDHKSGSSHQRYDFLTKGLEESWAQACRPTKIPLPSFPSFPGASRQVTEGRQNKQIMPRQGRHLALLLSPDLISRLLSRTEQS